MIQSISSSKKVGCQQALPTMTMLWQYSVIASRAHAEKALRKEENKGWHNLGPESSSRLEDAFQFARLGEIFFITFAPCIAYKMSVEKMFPSGMEMKQTTDKLGRRFLMRRAGVKSTLLFVDIKNEMDEDADRCDLSITLMSGRAVLDGSFPWRTPWKSIKCKCEDVVRSDKDLKSRMDWRGLLFVKGNRLLTPEDFQHNLGYKIEEKKDEEKQEKPKKKVKTANNTKNTKKTVLKKSAK